MRIVIDCNVVISAGLTDGTCRRAILKAFGENEVIVTELILNEYRLVSERPKFAKFRTIISQMIDIFEKSSLLVPDIVVKNISLPDENDLIYLYV